MSSSHESFIHPDAREAVRQAVISTPSAAQLGGEGFLPFVKFPFYPTSPWMSTNPNVGFQVRYYTVPTLASTDADFVVGTEVVRPVQFDIPARIVAFNGAAYPTTWVTPPVSGGVFLNVSEVNMNLLYKVKFEYTNGDKITTSSRIASNVVGRAGQPGEIGGSGYSVGGGSSLQVYITPLIAAISVDITLVCLEMRAPRNFNLGQ